MTHEETMKRLDELEAALLHAKTMEDFMKINTELNEILRDILARVEEL